MSPPTPRPVVLIGNTARFAKFVVPKLLPEYDVVHFTSDVEQAKQELTTILEGGEPPRDSNHVASANFSQLPKHIIFGKGFQLPELLRVRESAGNEESGLCWYYAPLKEGEVIKRDISDVTDSMIDMQTDKIVANMKRVLGEVINEGKEGVDGIHKL
ncbi:hypothetical protein M409DRAFT_16626 [Zasmidium cellare ATCC 36951]|uniref:Uncharacterized protein n=1 Tax=Zasmidium cellare ATCC 36951 TaxID=1080233 RepID=A0A6A6CZU4_ZASCE|nr:uncharacterized protein M409DRAFT_16626 [Zasmidium cellare ATCC 36951]KAF2172664.1 hypothetical protein M409DRAFT_16626 [Zasmidium cellare ATCC 36951]